MKKRYKELCTCKHCGKTYEGYKNTSTCDDCKDIDNMIFTQIRVYLRKYPNSNAIQISEALGISTNLIMKYIDEGRLFFGKGTFSKL
ncbi:MAG: hypothetical protein IKP88_18870 [Lachnospiraceae bacterium]|nr:hypothetical protein [Lachnospiraceae bacterium]